MWPEAPAPWTPGQGLPGHPDASPSAWDGARTRPSRNRASSLEPHTATTSAEYAGTMVLCCGPAFLQPHGTVGSHAAGLPSARHGTAVLQHAARGAMARGTIAPQCHTTAMRTLERWPLVLGGGFAARVLYVGVF